MKNQLLGTILTLLLVGTITVPVLAEDNATTGALRKNIRSDRVQVRGEEKQLKQDKKDLFQDLKNLKLMFGRLLNATVTNISGNSLTVTNNSKTYTILTDATTIFRRHFWGKSSLSEISVNDKINVWGKYTDDTKTSIQAHMIRDLSIMKRSGTFFGTVGSMNSPTIVLNTVNRGAQTVTIDSGTKCVERNMQTMNCFDIQVGQKIRVKGMWDQVNKAITEVTQIKDFTVPVKVTPTPKPTI